MALITFKGVCEVCDRHDVDCHNHHTIPKRLLDIIPVKKAKYWENRQIRICVRCNKFMHPENTLYAKIEGLKRELDKYKAENKMITVQININGNCIMAKSATRIGEIKDGIAQYRTDCNRVIEHKPEDGAIVLSHKLLDLLYDY
jgi:hypothetical protein